MSISCPRLNRPGFARSLSSMIDAAGTWYRRAILPSVSPFFTLHVAMRESFITYTLSMFRASRSSPSSGTSRLYLIEPGGVMFFRISGL